MWNSCSLSKNCHAVLEVTGQVHIAGVIEAPVTADLFIFSQDSSAYPPVVDVQQRINVSSDVLSPKHIGDESLSFRDPDFPN